MSDWIGRGQDQGGSPAGRPAQCKAGASPAPGKHDAGPVREGAPCQHARQEGRVPEVAAVGGGGGGSGGGGWSRPTGQRGQEQHLLQPPDAAEVGDEGSRAPCADVQEVHGAGSPPQRGVAPASIFPSPGRGTCRRRGRAAVDDHTWPADRSGYSPGALSAAPGMRCRSLGRSSGARRHGWGGVCIIRSYNP